MAMTGILAKLENAVTSEEQDSVLRSFVTTLVNSTDDYDNVEVLLQQLIGLASGSNFDYKTLYDNEKHIANKLCNGICPPTQLVVVRASSTAHMRVDHDTRGSKHARRHRWQLLWPIPSELTRLTLTSPAC